MTGENTMVEVLTSNADLRQLFPLNLQQEGSQGSPVFRRPTTWFGRRPLGAIKWTVRGCILHFMLLLHQGPSLHQNNITTLLPR